MFQNWFTTKCTAFVDDSGRALTGAALEAARHAPNARRCGHLVKTRAKFCSRCGSPTPNGWWRCGGCGQWIGNESLSCPHCGKRQDVDARLDLASGVWKKGDTIFAQRFDAQDVRPLLGSGLSVQEGQCAILLSGGAVIQALAPGLHRADELLSKSGEPREFVMVDASEIPFPVMVPDLMSKDSMSLELRCVVVIQLDTGSPSSFMANVMGSRSKVGKGEMTASLGYDDVAHFILHDVDLAAREFCVQHGIDELFQDAELRLRLEEAIASCLERNLAAAGLHFIRLKEVDFSGEAYERLRRQAGEQEVRRRELEFQLTAAAMEQDKALRDATRRKEAEDFLAQLAQEKQVKELMREQELARLRETWRLECATDEQEAQNSFELGDVKHRNEMKRAELEGELERRRLEHQELIRQRMEEQRASREAQAIETEIQKMQAEQKQRETRGWLDLRISKEETQTRLETERARAYHGLSPMALLGAIQDPTRADRVLKLAELEIQAGMSPELLLAAAAARGVPEAAAALNAASAEVRAVIERACQENREVYEKMLSMNERLFCKTAEAMEKGNANVPGTTIVK